MLKKIIIYSKDKFLLEEATQCLNKIYLNNTVQYCGDYYKNVLDVNDFKNDYIFCNCKLKDIETDAKFFVEFFNELKINFILPLNFQKSFYDFDGNIIDLDNNNNFYKDFINEMNYKNNLVKALESEIRKYKNEIEDESKIWNKKLIQQSEKITKEKDESTNNLKNSFRADLNIIKKLSVIQSKQNYSHRQKALMYDIIENTINEYLNFYEKTDDLPF